MNNRLNYHTLLYTHSYKPGSQYDARLSFCSVFRHFVLFRRAVHNVASLCAFLNFDPGYSGQTVGRKRLTHHGGAATFLPTGSDLLKRVYVAKRCVKGISI